MTDALIQHLVISTLFAGFVAGIIRIRTKDTARFRYRLWLAAALNFAIPTPILIRAGAWAHQLAPMPAIVRSVYPPSAQALRKLSSGWPQVGISAGWFPIELAIIWFVGALGFLLVWIWQFRSQRPQSKPAPTGLVQIVAELRQRIGLRRRVAVRSAMTGNDLAVYGIFDPVILIPNRFSCSLSREELEAVLAHELMHVRAWDNLAASIVRILRCIFWFHPALWWIERRLVVERESACDEAVIDQGWSANSYASGILKFCQFHFAELRAGACGFSDSNLQERMERIMSYKPAACIKRMSIILAGLGAGLTLTPAAVGFLTAHPMDAQSKPTVQERAASCVFADKHYPEGAIIHQDGGHEQLCAVALGRPIWVRTSPEIRQRGQSVVQVPAPVQQQAFCTPKTSNSKNICSCEEGGLYSPGSIVDSSGGQLSCSAGQWKPVARKKK